MEIGDELGGYTLVQRLGTGGAGTVWLATDGAGLKVALKLVHPALAASEEARARLRREAATVNAVATPRVARVVDIETDATQPFIATQFIEGPTLASLLSAGPLSPQAVAAIGADLAQTLSAVHAAKIVHRDIKPSNIMCSAEGPILIDFGIAMSDGDEHFTDDGLVSGTAGYTAPELLRGQEPDAGADWWAWAATLTAALTGRAPYGTGDSQGIIMRVLTGEPDVAGIDDHLVPALRLALSPDVSARPHPDDLVDTMLSLYGLPQGAREVAEVDWGALFASEAADPQRTQLIAPPEQASTEYVPETKALPTAKPAAPAASTALTAPPAGASYPMHQTDVFTSGDAAPDEDSREVILYESTGGDVDTTDDAEPEQEPYEPQLPKTSWFLVPVLFMPTALVLMLSGAVGSIVVVSLLLIATFVGACLRGREMRRQRAGGVQRSDTFAMIASSPLKLLRAIAGLAASLAFGALLPYVVWVANAYFSYGDPMWLSIPRLVATLRAPSFSDPVFSLPAGFLSVWLALWAALLLAWAMPTAIDLRDGVSRATRAFFKTWAGRALAVVLSISSVVVAWFVATGGLA